MRRAPALLLLLTAALAACGDDGGDVDATAALVAEACAPGEVPVEVEVCECAYGELADRFDTETLLDLDRELRDDPETVPPAVQEVVLECLARRVAPPVTKPEPSTTTTTESTTTTSSAPDRSEREP